MSDIGSSFHHLLAPVLSAWLCHAIIGMDVRRTYKGWAFIRLLAGMPCDVAPAGRLQTFRNGKRYKLAGFAARMFCLAEAMRCSLPDFALRACKAACRPNSTTIRMHSSTGFLWGANQDRVRAADGCLPGLLGVLHGCPLSIACWVIYF